MSNFLNRKKSWVNIIFLEYFCHACCILPRILLIFRATVRAEMSTRFMSTYIIYNVTLSLVTRELLSQSEAKNVCRNKSGFHLPVFYSLWEHNRFLDSSIIKDIKMTKLWLPQRRTPIEAGYQWMDSKKHCKLPFSFNRKDCKGSAVFF